jgi:hypothetical protein
MPTMHGVLVHWRCQQLRCKSLLVQVTVLLTRPAVVLPQVGHCFGNWHASWAALVPPHVCRCDPALIPAHPSAGFRIWWLGDELLCAAPT